MSEVRHISLWSERKRFQFVSQNGLFQKNIVLLHVKDINFFRADLLDFRSILSRPPGISRIFPHFISLNLPGNPPFFSQILEYPLEIPIDIEKQGNRGVTIFFSGKAKSPSNKFKVRIYPMFSDTVLFGSKFNSKC